MSKPVLEIDDIDPELLAQIPVVDPRPRHAAPAAAPRAQVHSPLHDLLLRAQGEMSGLVARELQRIEQGVLALQGGLEERLAHAEAENEDLREENARLAAREARLAAALQRLKDITSSLEDAS